MPFGGETSRYLKEFRLVPGLHGTKAEVNFAKDVLTRLFKNGIPGQTIALVGSRFSSDPLWLSRTAMAQICELRASNQQPTLALPDQTVWLKHLTELAKRKNMTPKTIHKLADSKELERLNPPEAVYGLLDASNILGVSPASDFDAVISMSRPAGVEPTIWDSKTGQHFDLFFTSDFEVPDIYADSY